MIPPAFSYILFYHILCSAAIIKMKKWNFWNRAKYDILLLVKYITRKSFFGTKKAGGNHEKENF